MVWVLWQGFGQGPPRPAGWTLHPSACSSDPCCPELQALVLGAFCRSPSSGGFFPGGCGALVSSVLFQQPATPPPHAANTARVPMPCPPWGAFRPVSVTQSCQPLAPQCPLPTAGRLFRKKRLEHGGMGETGAQLPGHLAGIASSFFLCSSSPAWNFVPPAPTRQGAPPSPDLDQRAAGIRPGLGCGAGPLSPPLEPSSGEIQKARTCFPPRSGGRSSGREGPSSEVRQELPSSDSKWESLSFLREKWVDGRQPPGHW